MDNDSIQIMVADLGQQVAEKALHVAEWKARALVAEAALAEIAGAEVEEEGPGLVAVPDVPEEGDET